MSNLTIKTINAAKQPGKLMDGDGLHLTVGRNQSKRWVHRFMFQGKRRDMGLGSYPTVSLAEARLRRDQNKRLLSEGIDPIEAAKTARAKADHKTERFRMKVTPASVVFASTGVMEDLVIPMVTFVSVDYFVAGGTFDRILVKNNVFHYVQVIEEGAAAVTARCDDF